MRRLKEQVARVADMHRNAVIERAADAVREALPGASVTIDGDRVVIEGVGLLRQWLENASLRSLGTRR